MEQQSKPISQWTLREVQDYVALTLESVAHVQGGLGVLTPGMLLGLAERLRKPDEAPVVLVYVPAAGRPVAYGPFENTKQAGNWGRKEALNVASEAPWYVLHLQGAEK